MQLWFYSQQKWSTEKCRPHKSTRRLSIMQKRDGNGRLDNQSILCFYVRNYKSGYTGACVALGLGGPGPFWPTGGPAGRWLGRTGPRDRTSALIQSPKSACHESHTRSDFSFIALFISILHAPSRADDNRVYFWITWYEIRSFVSLTDRKCSFKDATLTDRGGISNMIVAPEDVEYRQTPRKS